MAKTYQIENFHCNHFFLFMIFSAFMYQSVCVFGGGEPEDTSVSVSV